MLKELFAANKNIIINTDIDGILSGALLVKYCGCKVVGFTNSKDRVWLADDYNDLYAHIYVDMFVTDNKAICLDQHIVAINNKHQERIKALGNKYSPQIEGNRIFTNHGFTNKYPFGTSQYIIALLESEGFTIDLSDLNTPIENSVITLGDLIHRADDAMMSTLCTYIPNAKYWWDWLKDRSKNGQTICALTDYLELLKSTSKAKVDADKQSHTEEEYAAQLKADVDLIKRSTKEYFNQNFSCRTSDGGYKEITDTNGNLLENIKRYIETVFNLMKCDEVIIPKHYIAHKGVYCRTRWLPIFEGDFLKNYTICGHKVFSYAFIYSPGNDSKTNFSFTIDME